MSSSVLQAGAGLIGLAGVAALVLSYFWVQLSRSVKTELKEQKEAVEEAAERRIGELRGDIQDRDNRIDFLNEENRRRAERISRLGDELKASQGTIERMGQKLDDLERLIVGTERMDRLTDKLAEQNDLLRQHIAQLANHNRLTIEQHGDILGALGKVGSRQQELLAAITAAGGTMREIADALAD